DDSEASRAGEDEPRGKGHGPLDVWYEEHPPAERRPGAAGFEADRRVRKPPRGRREGEDRHRRLCGVARLTGGIAEGTIRSRRRKLRLVPEERAARALPPARRRADHGPRAATRPRA